MTTSGEQRILLKLDNIHTFMGEMQARQDNQEKQVSVLFKKHENLERNGCSKAELHQDHEARLRMVEHDRGDRPILPPEPRGVGIGKFLRIQGYSMQDVILLLVVLLIAGMGWKFIVREKQLSALEAGVQQIMEEVGNAK